MIIETRPFPKLRITDKGRACLLSETELEVLRRLSAGATTKQIAADHGLTDKWAQFTRSQIYRKTGLRNLADLCRFAIRIGLIQPCLAILACLTISGCAWPGIDRGSKPYPIYVPPTNAAASPQKMLAAPQTGTVTLAWNPSTSPGVSVYNLYYGPVGGSYTNHAQTKGTNVTLRLPRGSYQFAATAVDTNLAESAFSNTVGWTVKPRNQK